MLEVWDAEDVVSDHSHRVRWGDEEAMLTKDHVTVLEGHRQTRARSQRCKCEIYFVSNWKKEDTHPIAIKCCTKIILFVSHAVNQICSVGEVRIWVLTPKVLQWDTVDGRIGRAAQLLTEYSPHIRPYH